MALRLQEPVVLSYTDRALPPGRFPGLVDRPGCLHRACGTPASWCATHPGGGLMSSHLKVVARSNIQPRSRLKIDAMKHPKPSLGALSCSKTPGALLIGVRVRTRGLHCTAGFEPKHLSDPLGSEPSRDNARSASEVLMTSPSLRNALHRPLQLSATSLRDLDYCTATHTDSGLLVACSLRSGHAGDSHREFDPDTGELLTEWPARGKRYTDMAPDAANHRAA